MTEAQAIGGPPSARPAVRRGGSAWSRLLWPALALALLLLFDFFFVPNFFRFEITDGRLSSSIVQIFQRGAPVILLSAGMTLVIATGGVDLSVGAIMALASAVAAKLSHDAHLSPNLAVLAALGASILAGLWNGALVALLDIQPIVATLVLMVAGRGVAMLLIGAANVDLKGAIFDLLHGTILGLPSAGLLAIGVFIATGLLTRLTAAGLFIEAVGGNRTASRYAGVNVRLVVLLAYVFSGLCAGLAGLAFSSDVRKGNASQTGMYLELDAILAVVIGGTALTGGRFSLAGSLIGALLIQTLTMTLIYRVPIDRTLVVKALVVLLVCLLQSEGFRRKVLRRP